jgi:hypothetical protein
MRKLDPDCLRQPNLTMMVTNTGHLLPCGQLNVGQGVRDPGVQELMKYTKLSDYKSLNDLVNHPKWIEHFKNLENHIAPERCFYCCKAENSFNKHSAWTISSPDGEEDLEEK